MCSNIIPCPLCSQPAFSNSDSLRLALVSVATRHLSCPVCSELFLGLDKLTIHMFGHLHGLIQEKPLKIFTQNDLNFSPNYIISTAPKQQNFIICDNNFGTNLLATNNTIENKIVSSKKKEKVESLLFGCDICGFKFNDRKIVDMHKNLVHSNIEVNKNGETILPCHLCTKKFRMKGSLMIHLRVAHFGFPNLKTNDQQTVTVINNDNDKEILSSLNCNICNKTFLKQQQLNVHLKTHDNKQWECDICSKMFTTKYFLKKHKRLHTGEMPYNCNQCNKSFTFQQSYHKHMLYHSSDKPHVCGQCGRAFKELSTLHNHERIHSGERPFSCEICGKCFRQRVSCLVHRRIHTGVMPYHCTACGKKFRYKVSQRTHKCPAQPPGTVVRSENEMSPQIIESPNNETISLPVIYDQLSSNHRSTTPTNFILSKENSKSEKELFSDCPVDETNEKTENRHHNDTQNHLEVIKNTDFFSLVMSPMNVLSPSEKLQHLCLSNTPTPEMISTGNNLETDKQIMDSDEQSNLYNSICCDNNDVIVVGKNMTTGESIHSDSLQTINEESLKQLLYGP